MYLKRLEVSGFKSFADKTHLEFGQGITAVVGPNGSGKSNISDAMRWVLGEQSAKSLRGGKMDELIFAGSDARRPVNLAEVTLVLDNSDRTLNLEADEVMVTRRVHRNGDSDYLINRQSCRLKDIMELFMDTGLGKDAYSIIGQGKIEEILSTKAEDRRGIFEEASGIIKYKTRKKEAERKLADTHGNLTRLDDILHELGDQVEPLRRQAEKAELHRNLKAQIKSVEIGLFVHQMEQLQISWMENSQKAERMREDAAVAGAELSKVDAALESTRWTIQQLEEQIAGCTEQLLKASEETEKEEGVLELCKERRKNGEENLRLAGERIQLLQDELIKRRATEAVVAEHSETVRADLVERRTQLQLEERQLELAAQGLEGNAADLLQQQLFDAYQKQAQARNELRQLEQQEQSAKRRLHQWQEQEGQLAGQLESLERSLDAERAKYEQSRQLASDAAVQLEQSNSEMKQAELDAAEAERKLQSARQQLQALQARLETVQELSADYEGYAQGTREVLKANQRGGSLKGIYGAVAELVRVPARLETAVEIALGGALQHVVVESEADARQAIAFLKQRQAGRATFLPVQVIQGRSLSSRDVQTASQCNGWIGVASELVESEAKFRNIVDHLLGGILISETLEQANEIARVTGHRYRVVTLEGDVVHAGGSMTGGSVQRKGSSLLSRARQAEEMESRIAGLKLEIRDAEAGAKQAQERFAAAKAAREAASIQVNEWQPRLVREQSALEQFERDVRQLHDQMNWLHSEQQTQDGELAEAQEQYRQWQTVLQEATMQEQAIQQAMQRQEEDRKVQAAAKDSRHSKVTELHVVVATKTQELERYEDQLITIRERIQELEQQLKNEQSLVNKVKREMEQNEQAFQACTVSLENWRDQKKRFTFQLELHRAEKADQQSIVSAHELATRQQREQLKSLEDALYQLDMTIARQEVELDTVIRKLAEEYELSYELAKAKYPVPDDLPVAQQLVRDWKRQLNALGDVNPGAIEEYARVSERFTYLSEQRNDLMEAKQSLEQIIKEMNAEMGKKFMETFTQVRGHFVHVFRQLFGGGNADLILEQPHAPLESGVEIVAQPPGKKLQNLQLLSGGERALTAMALLFAILHVRPVPFCVLDEVEAALDEANVSRYAKFLRAFSKQTQFIVVTHRRGTMEEADVMYGVTMEEGGVSKLVSVHLEEMEERMPVPAAAG